MSKNIDDSRVFPLTINNSALERGMSLRQYAAIHLQVPDSGIDWLDKMIKESRKLNKEQNQKSFKSIG